MESKNFNSQQTNSNFAWLQIKKLLAWLLVATGFFSTSLGLTMLILPTDLYALNTERQEAEISINDKFSNAAQATSVKIADQQLTTAIDEIKQYIKHHPLPTSRTSESDDWQYWYENLLALKQKLDLGLQISSGHESPLTKLQLEQSLLELTKGFVEVKQTNVFGTPLASSYNVPPVPHQPNFVEDLVEKTRWPLTGGGVIVLGLGVVSVDRINDSEESEEEMGNGS